MTTNRIEQLLQEIAEQTSVDLIEHTIFQAGKRKIFRVYIDSRAGISVDICAKFSRELGTVLDLEELIDGEYVLEVSSPGLDRPLKTEKDFIRNVDKMLKLTFEQPIEGVTKNKFLVGKLLGVEEGSLRIQIKNEEVVIPQDKILTAKIEIQF